MRGTIPTRWLQALRRVPRRWMLRTAAVLAAVIAALAVGGAFRAKLHVAHGALLVRPDQASEGRAPAVIRDRLPVFLGAQRAQLLSDDVVIPALMKLDGLPADGQGASTDRLGYSHEAYCKFAAAHADRIDRLRDAMCVDISTSPEGASATIGLTVAWPPRTDGPGDPQLDPADRAAGNSCEITFNVLMAYLLHRVKLQAQREFNSPAARATRAARDDLDKARKAMESFLSGLQPQEMAAVAGGGWAGLDRLVAEGEIRARELNARLTDRQALIRAVALELSRSGKDPAYRIRVPAALAAEPPLAETTRAIAACDVKIDALAARGAEAAKLLAQGRAELSAHRRRLGDALRRCQAGLRETAARLEARRAGVAATLEADRKRLWSTAAKVARYRMLNEELTAARDACRRRRAAEPEARRAELRDRVGFEVSVLRAPRRPDPARPYRPVSWVSALAGLLSAGLVAAAYLLLVERRRAWLDAAGPSGCGDVRVLASIPRVGAGGVIRTE